MTTTLADLPSPPVTHWPAEAVYWPIRRVTREELAEIYPDPRAALPPTYAEVLAAVAGDREGNWADRAGRVHNRHPLMLAIVAALR